MQKNEIVPFGYDDQLVRTILIDDTPWFVAKDVCAALGLDNVSEALKKLDEDELTSETLMSGGQRREMYFVSESGLYTLILRSNKPEAKKFRKWVTSEVLPSIRKNGVYDATGAINDRLERMEKTLVRIEKGQNAQSGYISEKGREEFYEKLGLFGGFFKELNKRGERK